MSCRGRGLLRFSYSASRHQAPHSFPTRRSSDLVAVLGADVLLLQTRAVLLVQPIEADGGRRFAGGEHLDRQDRKSTRLNSSHEWSSYAVFCLKKKISRQLLPDSGPLLVPIGGYG